MNIKELIFKTITDQVVTNHYHTEYREPLIGYLAVDHPDMKKLKEIVNAEHLMPEDLLEGARTIIVYFIPFTKALIVENRQHPYIAPSWALAYVETNNLIADINNKLQEVLAGEQIICATLPATHNFDQEILMSHWSHRHLAYLAGLGTFGLNNMLITAKGCGGRYGSLVIDRALETITPQISERCRYKIDGSCGYCMQVCPAGAITPQGFDRHKCYAYLMKAVDYFQDIDPLCDVCGKCDCGPCAYF